MIQVGDVVKFLLFDQEIVGVIISRTLFRLEFGEHLMQKEVAIDVGNILINGHFCEHFVTRKLIDDVIRVSNEEAMLYKLENA